MALKLRITEKREYRCDGCGQWFEWCEGCASYGSLGEFHDNPDRLVFACSPGCQGAAKAAYRKRPRKRNQE